MANNLDLHGIEVEQIDKIGGPITISGTTVIGIIAEGVPTDADSPTDKFISVRNQQEASKIFGDPHADTATQMSKYLHAIFMESDGFVLAKGLSAEPVDSDIVGFDTIEAETKRSPNIIICPGITTAAGLSALNKVAKTYKGIAVADLEEITDAAVPDQTNEYVYHVYGQLNSGLGMLSASAATAGLIRKVDLEQGYWVSPSNKKFSGVIEIGLPVQWDIADKTCRANVLNQANITVFIAKNGIRPWGNRLGGGGFVNVKRVDSSIINAIEDNLQWAVDNNIGIATLDVVLESVNNYLRDLKSSGAILGGTCVAPKDQNAPDLVATGKIVFDYEFTPSYPAEHIKFRRFITNHRLEELFT